MIAQTSAEWILANGETLQVLTFFGLFLLLAVIERLAPRRPGPMNRRVRWTANLGLTAINLLSLGLIPVSLFGAANYAQENEWGLLNGVELPLAALIPLTLILRGFISFFVHYLMHEVPLLWRLHRVHHLDTKLDVTTTVRMHPLEFVAGALLGAPLVVAFGLTPWVLMLYELLDVAVTLWSHSNVRLPAAVNRIVRYVIVTPELHRIHHSAWRPETDSNFGAVFPIWDLVFGTFRAEARQGSVPMRLGLDEVRGRAAHRLTWLLLSVFRADLAGTADAKVVESSRSLDRLPGF